MSGWPIALGLGAGGPLAFLEYGLAAATPSSSSTGGASIMLNAARTIVPVFPSGYAGRDFPALSSAADDVFAIDLSAGLDQGDALVPGSLATLFYPVDIPVAGYAAALDGPPALLGSGANPTVAAQAITQPAAARYLLGFTCGTVSGRRIELHAFFTAMGIPDAA
jgi:hypothetical protein